MKVKMLTKFHFGNSWLKCESLVFYFSSKEYQIKQYMILQLSKILNQKYKC